MSNQAPKTGPEAVAVLLKPLLDEVVKSINNNLTVQITELHQKLEAVNAQLLVLQNLQSEKKKGVNRKAADATTTTAETTAEGTPAPVQNVTKSALPANKMFYFRDKYKLDAEYRAKFVTEDIRKKMDDDPTISQKKDPAQKLMCESQYMWTYIKNHMPTSVMDEINKEYEELKKAHANSNKAPQQNIESATPPDGK